MPQKGGFMGNRQYQQLEIDDRMIIQACLHDHQSLLEISRRIGVSKSTIFRELKRNAKIKKGHPIPCRTLRAYIVCNVCNKRAFCTRQKLYYDFNHAQSLTHNRLHINRSFVKLAADELTYVDTVVTTGVKLGQSLHHIYIGDARLKKICCERTIRRLVYRGNLSIRPHELRRYVRYKREYQTTPATLHLRDIRALIGRTHKDYLRYVKQHKRLNIVQYDSLIGQARDEQALLTITFPAYNFQFGILVKKGVSTSTNQVLSSLFHRLGPDLVKRVFPVNLCDNGIEFASFHKLEADEHGELIVKTFYTNPYRATDKAPAERNHELVRYCLPKRHSLDGLTQDVVDDMFSHINSYVRASKGDKTPYDLVKARFGKPFLDLINIVRIPNKKVKLVSIV